jgi:hypothetical protein
MFVPVQRMCVSHIALAFSKFEEFWTHYHDLVPEAHRRPCKDILREIRERKITEFRNRCVGHIWNKDEKRPLKQSEIMAALEKMARSDFNGFLQWVNTPRNNYPDTVVSVVEAVRDGIFQEWRIDPREAIER